MSQITLAPIALLMITFSPTNWAEDNVPQSLTIKPYQATYNILHKHKKVGEGKRTLEAIDNGLTKYSYNTDIEWLIFSDTRKETSIVKVDNNQVLPTHYDYIREGTGRDKSYEWTYNVTNNKAKNVKKNKELTIEFPENIQDKLSYQLQHRLNMMANPEQKQYSYTVIGTSGKIKDYVFDYDGEEEIVLPYGLVKTIRLKREVAEKKRITYAWFAPELDYLMVKLYQIKGDVEQFEAQLNTLEYLPAPVNNTL